VPAPPEFLRKVGLFESVSDRDIKRLAEALKERAFSEGDAIVTQGEGGVGFFVIGEGTVEYSVDGERVGSGGPGDYFGELALIDDEPRSATVTAATEVTVYAMTVVGKAKIARADESERSGCDWEPNAPRPMPTAQSLIRCKNASMSDFEQFLQHGAGAYIDHPIVDATGLEGGWDFLIGWTPKAMLQPAQSSGANAPGGATVEASAPDGITLFEALERQLGLKLVKEKRSIPVVVVDHVDETPLN